MPKQKLTEREQKYRAFQGIVMKQLTLLEISKEQQAQVLRISRSTLWAKMKDPSTFRVGEQLMLFDVLKFSDEEKHVLF